MKAIKLVFLSIITGVLVFICYDRNEVAFPTNTSNHTPFEYPKMMPWWKKFSNLSETNFFRPNMSLNKSYSEEIQDWMRLMESRYSKSIENIKTVCKKYRKGNSTKLPLHSLMVDHRHGLAFCRNAKVGSTTWMHHFNALIRDNNELRKSNGIGVADKKTGLRRKKVIKKLKPKEIFRYMDTHGWIDSSIYDEFVRNHNLTTFTFVRHPFERIVSAYNGKVKSEKFPNEYNYESFPEFIEHRVLKELESKQQLKVNIHWMPFIDRCYHCDIPYSVIGRIETFQEDVTYIIMKNNLQTILDLESAPFFHSLNASKNDTKKETIDYFFQLNITQIQRLYQAYTMDFELFGYNIDVYLRDYY